MPSAGIRALILDFDGLIVDTESPIFEIWRDIFRRDGQELQLDDWKTALGTQGGYDPVEHLARLTGRSFDVARIEREARERHWQACREQALLPGVSDLVADAQRLVLPMAVASSSPRAWVRDWLDHHGIRERFGAICAREDVGQVKPAPDLFLLAARRLGVEPSSCLVFEDSPNGLCAARAAGMRSVAVRNDVTRSLALPPSDLVLESLAEMRLAEILDRLGRQRSRDGQDGITQR
jgi:HAD superfamily hydrolase (TIGR01509 family)